MQPIAAWVDKEFVLSIPYNVLRNYELNRQWKIYTTTYEDDMTNI